MKKTKGHTVLEMGFPISGNGTIDVNGSAISRIGKLLVWVLTYQRIMSKT